MKYKMSFTIDSEALFSIMARMLPIDDLAVEEVAPIMPPQAAIRFDKRFDQPPKSTRKGEKRKKGSADLTQGVNAIIMSVLADGAPYKYSELREAIAKTTYSPNGIGSRVDRLVEFGYVVRLGGGMYRATNKGLEAYIGQKETEA
jgi:hypothetical protein